jgi:hypothetical protein
VWKDGTSLFGDEKVCLFQADVHPDDVKQGVLGNCWLISAIAAMAEFPGAVQNMMPTKERSRRGKYSLRLWNELKKKWVVVTVDDQIPCNTSNGGLPHFAKPNGNEMWVMLFEKAFAKYCGSYKNLVGGHSTLSRTRLISVRPAHLLTLLSLLTLLLQFLLRILLTRIAELAFLTLLTISAILTLLNSSYLPRRTHPCTLLALHTQAFHYGHSRR